MVNILYLEDDFNDVEILQYSLENKKIDYKIIWISSIEDFNAYDKSDIDFIILDVNINGKDATNEIKTEGIPYIITSGENRKYLPLAFVKNGSVSFIHKPISVLQLQVIIEAVLGEKCK